MATLANDEVVLGQTNGNVDLVTGSGDAGGGLTANGQATGIYLNDNAQANLLGSSDTVNLGTGDSLGAYGGGNTVATLANDEVVLGQTNGNFDTIDGNGDVTGNQTANGQSTGIYLDDNAQANLIGTTNSVGLGQNDTLTVLSGSSNNTVTVTGSGSAVFPQDEGQLTVIGTPTNTAALNESLSHSPATANQIDEVYAEVLGRGADPTGLADAENDLGVGLSIQDLTAKLAGSTEALSDLNATYASFEDAPTEAETSTFVQLLSQPYGTPIAIYGQNGLLADTSAGNILAELPVLETLDNGRTLQIGSPSSGVFGLSSTAEVVSVLYALSVQQSQVTAFTTQDFQLDQNWLNQVDQPMLEVADEFEDSAAVAQSQGNQNLVILDNTAANISLQIAAEAPGSRTAITQTVSLSDHKTEVTIDPNTANPYSSAVFHDIDPGIGGLLEAIGLAVLNVAAAVFPETGLPYAAAAADAAEAGNDFANGQAISGVLSLASAVGEFGIGLGAVNQVVGASATGQAVLTAAQGVGGVYGAVQNAQDGDALGVLSGVLEATAGISGGIAQTTNGTVNTLATQIEAGLNIAGTAITTAAAFEQGDLAGGLITSLGAIFTQVATDYNAQQALTTGQVNIANITPTTINGHGSTIAFVGGFFDRTTNGPVSQAYNKYLLDVGYDPNNPPSNVNYLTFDQGNQLSAFIDQNMGNSTVVGHSYGGDTAATAVANSRYVVNRLITVDPVSYARPDFSEVASHTLIWQDYNAVGGTGLDFSNVVAGIGSAWNTAPQGSATLFQNVNLTHAQIGGASFIDRVLGVR